MPVLFLVCRPHSQIQRFMVHPSGTPIYVFSLLVVRFIHARFLDFPREGALSRHRYSAIYAGSLSAWWITHPELDGQSSGVYS
jgi:hypothetical protein